MCIIAYLEKGVKISDATLERMFDGNPDGAGVMWKPADGSDIQIRKGFMSVKALKKAVHSLPLDCERAIHCRIATAGKVSVGCCHPFPVRPKTTMMAKSTDHAPIAYMHNGVIPWCNPKGGIKASESDTMIFGANVLYKYRKILGDTEMQTLLEESINGSRLLVFRKDADTIMLGNWQESEGVYYSNGSYKPYTHPYSGWGYKSNSLPYSQCDFSGYSYDDDCYDEGEYSQAQYDEFANYEYFTNEKGEKVYDLYRVVLSVDAGADLDRVYDDIEDLTGLPIVDDYFEMVAGSKKLTLFFEEEFDFSLGGIIDGVTQIGEGWDLHVLRKDEATKGTIKG